MPPLSRREGHWPPPLKPDGFIDYRAARSWASDVDMALDAVENLLKSGNGADVIEICEYGLHKLLESIQSVDDSDGHFTTLRDRVEQIQSRHGRFQITQIMELLAIIDGDVEQLVGVMGRDLTSAYKYWRIALVYQEGKQHDNSLLWAEKGLKAFPEHTDSRLRDFAASEYHRRKRRGDAMAIVWAAFRERRFLETYS